MDTQFLYLHRISLVALGVWPYHRTMFVQLHACVFCLTMISFLIFQLTPFLTTECTIECIIEILSTSLYLLLCLIHYISFWINTHVVKHVLEYLQCACSELKDENEIAIIKRYGHIAKCVAIGIILLAMCGLFIMTLLPFLPRIYGTFFLVNKSEPYPNTFIITEYFIDEEKYFYFILLHQGAAYYIAVGTMIAAGIVVTGYCTYSCGFCAIASYRIDQAIRITSDEVTNRKNKSKINKKISHAVNIHHTTLEFIEFFLHNFEGTYTLLLAIVVICLSLHLFGLCQAILFADRMQEFVLHYTFTLSILICTLGGNYVGQAVTDHYNYIFLSAYNVRWYIAPLRVQRLIVFLLQKGTKPYSMKVGGLYTISLENFASLSTAAISYFTVLYSLQN
ncbi:ObirOr5-9E50 [Ooceraea biroi]|uniref:Odorant receptor n=2 Tax=Ooceraea biroi TaxID=2015173 RepID=A0A3L8DZ68_OOCBI|nr:ObirOr5-9E50 [Ooceraea biroi]